MLLAKNASDLTLRLLLALTLALVVAACGAQRRPAADEGPALAQEDKPGAPLFGNLGDHHVPITTHSEKAQRYFDQGVTLAYGFNHAEAIRSFREAQRLDPDCAMCFWGEALAYGPNINAPMAPEAVEHAWVALEQAVAKANTAAVTGRERAYIRALQKRYQADPPGDRSALDLAYANAMRDVAAQYPDDLDAKTLFAEALMDTMPWDYYVDPDSPKPAALEVIAALESVMDVNADHPGALHLYIHIIEPSSTPTRAEAAADRLADLVPGAGHLVHMPSHIYYRGGRYQDAAEANERASAADESYIAACKAQGFYPAGYYPHNIHFLWASASLEGRSRVALDTARKLTDAVPAEAFKEFPFLEEFAPTYYVTLARFGLWQEILEEPAPPQWLRYTTGIWHYVRGFALVNLGRSDEATPELAAVRAIAASDELAELVLFSGAAAKVLLGVASDVLGAELAAARGDHAEAIAALEAAIEKQDNFAYTEPPPWYFPVRQALGAQLLALGRAADAEAVYRQDLENHPRNGWSLFGLAESLRAQGKDDAAESVADRFQKAWARADVKLSASFF
jgi:tetratricopeptide (TPR) repeat protein